MKQPRIFSHFYQRIVALILAILIWGYATSRKDTQVSESQFLIPITYTNLPKNFIVSSQDTNSISITLQVPVSELSTLNPSLFQAIIDLSNISLGKQKIEIKSDFIRTPFPVNISNIFPKKVTFKVERLVEKRVAIRPNVVGEPQTGLVIEEIKLLPEEVDVAGPEKIVKPLDAIYTSTIDIAGLKDNFEKIVNLIVPDKVRLINGDENQVIINLSFGEEGQSLLLKDVPIKLTNQKYVTRVNPVNVNLLLRGPKKIMPSLSKKDAQVVIDLTKLEPGEYKMKPKVLIRSEIQVQKIWPPVDIWILNQKFIP